MLIGVYKKSVVLTYVGLASSIIGIFLAFQKNIDLAMICYIIAGICDLFDGFIARKCDRNNMEKEFGIQIDSLVDVVSFGIFPIIIFLNLEFNSIIHMIGYVLYASAAITRLAYFNVNAKIDTPIKHYTGLPVTASTIIFSLAYMLKGFMSARIFGIVYTILMFVTAFLFVLKIKVPKLTGKWYIVFGALALVGIVMIVVG